MTALSTASDLEVTALQRRAVANLAILQGKFGIACSGGSDSTALLLSAVDALEQKQIEPLAVLHVDHGARAESGAEAKRVAELCRSLRVPLCRLEVNAGSRDMSASPEEWLRNLRYTALASAVHRLGLDGVATAHTFDDQLETVLLRLFSGTGAVGAAGMRPDVTLQTDAGPLRVVRPLLEMRRAELRAIVEDSGITPIEDPSNRDQRFRRNALRHSVIPSIVEHFPGFDQALLRSIALSARDGECLDEIAERELSREVSRDEEGVRLSRKWVRNSPAPIVSRVIRRIASPLLSGDIREFTFERTEAVRVAASGRTGAMLELPGGIRVRVERENIVFMSARGNSGE